MSGHSHWAGIKHRKGINDAKRAKIFTKHGKLITIAAHAGGGNPDTNFQLRLAIDRARGDNMPKESIGRSIKRGTGELKGEAEIQEVLYEAYGPGQVAMLIRAATENKNRTLGDLKIILTKSGGKIVPAGSVSYLFKRTHKDSELVYEPMRKITLDENAELDYKNLLELLDKQDDVQEIYDNL